MNNAKTNKLKPINQNKAKKRKDMISNNKSIKTLSYGYGQLVKKSVSIAPSLFGAGIQKLIKNHNNIQAVHEDKAIIDIAHDWIDHNNQYLDNLMPQKDWRIFMPNDLKIDGRYLLICNHQSWVDTSVIQYISANKLPLTRFFAKHELLYIPIVGQAFYLLDFPMMKRQKDNQRDLHEARRACKLLSDKPFVLLNYLEGTRFTKAKHTAQNSPYRHLLKPKAGGLALAIASLGDTIDGILDMTIAYPNGIPSYHDLWRGQVDRLAVDIRRLDMPQPLFEALKLGQYHSDKIVKKDFYVYLDSVWTQKDDRLGQLLAMFDR